ncbi:6-phosphogluconate dehydrogenase [Pantoea stewartii]|uniref:6-phosphogluconate dehydrogenase n=2 Tax=Erwiniaceae TaxID=1903409 RepID=A0AB34VHU9_9GAMM|nr:6-phosphogluconate dehydrogenase [Pantoea stewartii]KTS99849.1 6-phosphogluconate dehydrogenase [Pantoea stewartii]KTT05419.1 6-phosphogluconate dehydrogenase [Pantoea stewartii]MBC0853540.1 NAD(P)-dependent oxidoreductase [Pantoea stewartii]NRH22513.1 6-phosphogluconate dehydrogenase [Pantoea stewartii]
MSNTGLTIHYKEISMNVAVLGLGAMGHAFAANLLKKGFEVHGWNRTRARGEDLVDAGLNLADSASEAVSEADVVIAMLSDGETTAQVLHEVNAALKQGATLCQMGTIGVEKTDALIAFFAQTRPDVVFIDAPVSGTKAPAENAQILVLASGDRSRAQAAEAVFAAIGKGTQWLGEAGKSSRMKLVINSWLIGLMQSLAESNRLAEQFGFSTHDLWQVLDGGPLAAPYAKMKLAMMESEDYTPQMHLQWALKDARLALEASDSTLPALENIARVWQQAVEAGHGEEDLAVIYKYLKSQ